MTAALRSGDAQVLDLSDLDHLELIAGEVFLPQ
jgi:hypothetical protein